jgi:hypothetical protein
MKSKFAKSNKLAPLDDGSDIDLYSKNGKSPASWAVTNNTGITRIFFFNKSILEFVLFK